MAIFVATRRIEWSGTHKNATAGLLSPPTASIGIANSNDYTTGSGANQVNAWYATTRSAAAAADTIDLDADLADAFGTTLVFTSIKEIWIINRSTASGEDLTISGDAMLAFVGNNAHQAKAAAGGMWHQSAPVDGFAISSPDQDVLSIDPGANTISYDLIIAGVV